MPTQRPLLSSFVLSVVSLFSAAATAAGIGLGASGAILGQPLDFAVPVRLEPGEPLDAPCVQAEVTVGDRRLPPSLVQVRLDRSGVDSVTVHVLTSLAVDEPVVGVDLTVGCGPRIGRRFVVLADPPPALAPSRLPPPLAVAAEPPAAAASPGAEPLAAGALAGSAAPAGLPAARQPRPPRAAAAAAATTRAAEARAVRRAAGAAARRQAARQAAQRTAVRASTAPAPLAAATPRLKLDMVEPAGGAPVGDAVDQALQAVAQAASAARAAASAASAADERIASLERTVEQLRTENKSRSDQVTVLRDRLSQVGNASRWLWPLVALAAAMAALAVWLGWRLALQQRRQQAGWHQSPTPATAAGVAGASGPTVAAPAGLPAARLAVAAAWPPAAPADDWAPSSMSSDLGRADPATEPARRPQTQTVPLAPPPPQPAPARAGSGEPATQRTQVLPSRAVADEGSTRDVSIEELIDLEQQAEFFVVLGQDAAAVDLLMDHLRQTGGSSPLPYLKLLEIHQRRGDRIAYERIRARFNHHFNAYAPEWGADMHAGRALEDYSGVLPRLQQVWSRPLDAMAELEALLFRKSRGDLFELPAYREVLFLYSLARDLLDREAADSGSVDLLLPLADGGDFSSTSPAPFLGLERPAAPEAEGRGTLTLDFDISMPEPGGSIFDPLDSVPPPLPRTR